MATFSSTFNTLKVADTPTVNTNKPGYASSETEIIKAESWQPNEQVKLDINHSKIAHGYTLLYAKADENGKT